MHHIRVILAILTAAAVAVYAQSLDDDDVPSQCLDICRPVIQLEQQCDSRYSDDDNDNDPPGPDNNDIPSAPDNSNNPPAPNTNQQYRDCVCGGSNATQALQACQQCTAEYPDYFLDNDDDDSEETEIEAWLRSCGVQAGGGPVTPLPNGTATSTPTGVQSSPTPVTPSPCPGDTNDGDDTNSCTSTGIDLVGDDVVESPSVSPIPTSVPTALVTRSMSSVTQTFACLHNEDDPNDGDEDRNGLDTCTRTTLAPVGATTGTLVPTGTLDTEAIGTGTTASTGAAAMATVMPYVGAGAMFMLAGFAV